MRRPLLLAAAIAVTGGSLGLLAWSERPQPRVQGARAALRTMDVEEAPPPFEVPKAMAPPAAPVAPPPPAEQAAPASAARAANYEPAERPDALLPATAPRVAYTYAYRFRIPGDAVAPLQERHLQLCLSLGAMRCRVVSMQRGETRADAPSPDASAPPPPPTTAAALEVEVAAPLAERFGRELSAGAREAGGETVDRQIAAEDVSHEMVDAEARIRTREILIGRLSALLETRSGNIQQAVEAERAINQAQEELDAARAWLAENRGRVAMSRVAIAYQAAGAAATSRPGRNPIATSLGRIGTLTTMSLAALLLVAGLALPWGALAFLVVWVARWHRRRSESLEAEMS